MHTSLPLPWFLDTNLITNPRPAPHQRREENQARMKGSNSNLLVVDGQVMPCERRRRGESPPVPSPASVGVP